MGWRGIYMAMHLIVATIKQVSNTDTWFLAESELKSFSKLVKMSYYDANRSLNRVEKGWRGIYMAKH